MYNLIFLLLFVTILCHGKSTCDKQTPVCDKKVDPVCRKTPFTFCVPNIIQNNTQCVCDTTKTKMVRASDGSFVCTTEIFRCNSTNPNICCQDGYRLSNKFNTCLKKFPIPLNNSYTCNLTADSDIRCYKINNWYTITLGDGCYANFTGANPNITIEENYIGTCCPNINQYFDTMTGVCQCSLSIPPPYPQFQEICSYPQCNLQSCNTFYPGSSYNGITFNNCACLSHQNFTYDCTQYTCEDKCTPGATLRPQSPSIQTIGLVNASCRCPDPNFKCPPGSNGLDLTCNEIELLKEKCYTDGKYYYSQNGIPCNCNWTKLSDKPCPIPCLNATTLCSQKEGFKYPRCSVAKGPCGKPCNVCSQVVAPTGTYCRDVTLDGKCIASFYHKCGECEYPGPQRACPQSIN